MFDPTPVSALGNIYSVKKLICAQTQLAQANQEQCKRLSERIRIIEQSVCDVEKIKDKGQQEKGLSDLLMGLQRCLQFSGSRNMIRSAICPH